MTLEEKQKMFGWKIKERFTLDGEEILDESEIIKIKFKRDDINKIGTAKNKNRMSIRIRKKKMKQRGKGLRDPKKEKLFGKVKKKLMVGFTRIRL
jgi:hypothetical protein